MSRLVENDVRDLAAHLREYDERLRAICGTGLSGIAMNAAGCNKMADGVCVGVVPITTGLGLIGGFTAAVAGIVRFLGADTFVTENTDIGGMREAVDRGCEILFAADDDAFIAMSLSKRQVSDNSEATGRGFAAALDLAAASIRGKRALVIGAGPVGFAAAATLHKRGALVSVFDLQRDKARQLREQIPAIELPDTLEQALRENPYILDATPAREFLRADMLRNDTIISAPGVPLGVDQTGRSELKGRLVHDVLELGVSTMLFDLL